MQVTGNKTLYMILLNNPTRIKLQMGIKQKKMVQFHLPAHGFPTNMSWENHRQKKRNIIVFKFQIFKTSEYKYGVSQFMWRANRHHDFSPLIFKGVK